MDNGPHTTLPDPTDGSELGGLSLCELEYAHKLRDHLETGDVRPDAAGFDRARVGVIERVLRARFRLQAQSFRHVRVAKRAR